MRLIPTLLIVLLLAACSPGYHVGTRAHPAHHAPRVDAPGHSRAPLHIPPGHLPEPGLCRIWVPGVPPGQQSPPAPCSQLAGQVPPGALLISRASRKSKEFDAAVYDRVLVDVVVEVRVYSTKSGKFIGLR